MSKTLREQIVIKSENRSKLLNSKNERRGPAPKVCTCLIGRWAEAGEARGGGREGGWERYRCEISTRKKASKSKMSTKQLETICKIVNVSVVYFSSIFYKIANVIFNTNF